METGNATTRSYLDFQGLGELRSQAARDGKGALRETAQQFEAMFLQMMLKSMRESIEKSELTASAHADTFESMFDREVSMSLARRNAVGLADMLVEQAQVRAKAVELATEIATSSPIAVQSTRATLRAGFVEQFRLAVARESIEQNAHFKTEDFQEGVKAMAERRAPRFEGR